MSLDTLPRPTGRGHTNATPYPRDRCLHEVFDDQAVLRPRATAAVHNGRSLTYGEIARRSDAVAARLLDLGVRPGDTIGVLGGRSIEAVVAFLGILKAGAAYVPLDDGEPPRRVQAMAEQAGLNTVLILPGGTCRIRRIRHVDFDTTPASAPAGFRRAVVAAMDCAYVMFTSGSTGEPKPVAIPHRGVTRLAFSELVTQRPQPGERVLHAYGLSSDASTIEIWSALLAGACLVLVDRADLLSPEALEARLVTGRVAIAYLTTGVFHHIARTRSMALRTLRFVSAGGEVMDPDLTRAVLSACPDTTVVNFYGPTENSVVSTAYLVRDLPPQATTVPIGQPLENSCCHVVRADGTPAEAGEEGDLLVGGDGLALGYLGDPELTRQRFIMTERGERWYRTGDRAVWLPTGELEYRGRADRQIKLRGHRVELDEIEARLRASEHVGEAVVDLDHGTLTGYLTPAKPGQAIPVDRIRKDLASWLPAAVVPAGLIPVDRFPVTEAGKIDRRRLRALSALTATSPPTSYDSGGHVDKLAGIWHTVLRVRPAPTDNFYELGGDSLLAAETVTRTLAALEIDARHGSALIHSLLRNPTLRGFADAVTSIHTGGAFTTTVDFASEARLGFTVPAAHGPAPLWRNPQEVLVTGASGFVGAFLVDRLLRTTTARVHCPVRARDHAAAHSRVHTAFARFGLTPPDTGRLVCFPADLSTPGLGLQPGHLTQLSSTVDLVFHAAAQVNFLYPYEALRAANVGGTREVVRLAAPRRVPVHFLSTIAVLAGFGTAGVCHVAEDQPLAHADRLTMGYAESKWVAEKMLQNAAEYGVPVAVHRPYEITGDQQTGACNTETAICSLFHTIAETGLAPDIPLPMNFVPVDYLAAAIVHIATHHPTTDRIYHVTNPSPAGLADMLDRMRAAGHQITTLPYHQWVDELLRHVAANPTSPTAPFVSLCVDRGNKSSITVKEMYFEGTFPRLDRANVERDLAGSGLVCPPVDTALLDRYMEYFYRTGYLNRPSGEGNRS
jgi:amino acid adenylation domain-containing protein/thioester reductase-like protein